MFRLVDAKGVVYILDMTVDQMSDCRPERQFALDLGVGINRLARLRKSGKADGCWVKAFGGIVWFVSRSEHVKSLLNTQKEQSEQNKAVLVGLRSKEKRLYTARLAGSDQYIIVAAKKLHPLGTTFHVEHFDGAYWKEVDAQGVSTTC